MIFAWIGAALIGLSLGLLGSGGSILTVPVLVYLVGEPEKLAIAESLAIVGGISLVGAIPYALKNGMLVRPHKAIALRNPAIRRLSLLSLVLIASPPSLDSPCSSPQKGGVLAALLPGLVPTVVRSAGRG